MFGCCLCTQSTAAPLCLLQNVTPEMNEQTQSFDCADAGNSLVGDLRLLMTPNQRVQCPPSPATLRHRRSRGVACSQALSLTAPVQPPPAALFSRCHRWRTLELCQLPPRRQQHTPRARARRRRRRPPRPPGSERRGTTLQPPLSAPRRHHRRCCRCRLPPGASWRRPAASFAAGRTGARLRGGRPPSARRRRPRRLRACASARRTLQ